ncbi:MAG: nucleotidyltransferase domain-containing protein [Bacteroidales bacterium]|nr:nucleotidyltransferase domain-containing protein [Bacteroidales bacterium]
MDKNEVIKIVKKYIDSISKKFQIETALLFGLYTKGTNHPGSDIDIAIVFRSVDNIIDLQIQFMQLCRDEDLLMNIIHAQHNEEVGDYLRSIFKESFRPSVKLL